MTIIKIQDFRNKKVTLILLGVGSLGQDQRSSAFRALSPQLLAPNP